jgi:hypothetical protein
LRSRLPAQSQPDVTLVMVWLGNVLNYDKEI